MDNKKIITWCQANNWTEPREIEDGIWVAYPPNGVIENLIPHQSLHLEKNSKNFAITWFLYAPLLLISASIVAIASICLIPFFLVNHKR